MDTQTKAGPRHAFTVWGYRFARYGWTRWECAAHGRGCAARTPWGAFLRLRRFLKVMLRPDRESA